MTTVFITAFQNMVTKNILNTRVFSDLLKKDIRIVIFCQSEKVEFFQGMFNQPNIIIKGISVPDVTLAPLPKLYLRLAYLLVDSHYLWYKKSNAGIKNRQLSVI